EEEHKKAARLGAGAKGGGQPEKASPGKNQVPLEPLSALAPPPPYQIALQILEFWQVGRHRSRAGLIMAGRGIEPQRFMGPLEVVSITKRFEAFAAVLVIAPDGGLP